MSNSDDSTASSDSKKSPDFSEFVDSIATSIIKCLEANRAKIQGSAHFHQKKVHFVSESPKDLGLFPCALVRRGEVQQHLSQSFQVQWNIVCAVIDTDRELLDNFSNSVFSVLSGPIDFSDLHSTISKNRIRIGPVDSVKWNDDCSVFRKAISLQTTFKISPLQVKDSSANLREEMQPGEPAVRDKVDLTLPQLPKVSSRGVENESKLQLEKDHHGAEVSNKYPPRTKKALSPWTITIVLFGILSTGLYLAKFPLYIVPVAFVFWVLILSRKECPNCKGWFCRATEKTEQIGSSTQGLTSVLRRDQHRDKSGKVFATTDRWEQVAYTDTTYRYSFKCKKCGHRWTKVASTRSGGY